MKHLFLISCFLLIVFQQSIYSQQFCFTPATSSNSSFAITSSSGVITPKTLRVYFHVIRRSDGTGGYLPYQVEESLNILQGHFNSHEIFFAWDGCINYIDKSSYFNTGFRDFLNGLYNIDNHTDGIDIYLNHANSSIEGGKANGVGNSSELWISGRWFGSTPTALTPVLSHEMGHVLWLFHTHHGCETGNWELIDNTGCVDGPSAGGDFICDTNADPNIRYNVDSNCEWTGQEDEEQDEICLTPEPLEDYNPDPRNIMAYSKPNCQEYFTTGQSERMHEGINSLQHLDNCIVSGTPETDYCECPPDDVFITENTVIDHDLYIPGDLIILNGAELTIQSTVYFNNDYGVKIQENSKLILNGATLGSCENSWKGIHVVNGELEANDSYIFNARKGIKARSGTTLNLENTEIIGNSGLIGVYLI